LNNDEAIAQILDLLSDDVVCIYIGLPLSLSGSHTQSTKMAINFASALSKRTDVPLRLIDERLTSKSASQALRQAGKNSREQKGIIDASAAAMILDFAISSERDGFSGKRLEELNA
jgi:putative Holliday junction resolvase